MEKIILTKEQALALEKALGDIKTKEEVLKVHANLEFTTRKWIGDNYQYLNELTLEELAISIYIGYEVEETKEEKLSKYFKLHDEKDGYFNIGVVEGILKTLKFLDVKIKGINE